MNCSHNCMMCRVWKYIKKHFKNFVIKTIIFFNMLSLMYWIVYIDYIISWQPYAIMAFNFAWICLVLYANGWVIDTEPYYERLENEGE